MAHWRDAFGGAAGEFRRFGRSSGQVRASFELPTAQAPLLSSPLPQTAEATPHFARQTRGNVCIMSWRRAVPLGSTDKTYHEPLTYAMPREGYTRLPRAYISHPVELK